MSDVLTTHSEFEARFEDEAFHQRALEAHRQAAYRAAHADSLDGYTPLREFPCRGLLRIVPSDVPGPQIVYCDQCPYITSVPAPGRRAERERQPVARADW